MAEVQVDYLIIRLLEMRNTVNLNPERRGECERRVRVSRVQTKTRTSFHFPLSSQTTTLEDRTFIFQMTRPEFHHPSPFLRFLRAVSGPPDERLHVDGRRE
jgi:hypothetical protein